MDRLVQVLEYFILTFLISLFLNSTFLIKKNADIYCSVLQSNFEIAVFLKKNVSAPEVVFEKIRAIEGIKKAEFISKDAIKNKLKYLNDEVLLTDENPFPDSFSLVPGETNSKKIEKIVSELKKIDEVEEIKYDANLVKIVETLKIIVNFLRFILVFAPSLIVILLFFSVSVKSSEIVTILKQKDFYLKISSGLSGFIFSIILTIIYVKKFFQNGLFALLSIKEILPVLIIILIFNLWKNLKEA